MTTKKPKKPNKAESEDKNEAAFREKLGELLAAHRGKYALFGNGEFVDAYDSFTAAYDQGVERFGLEPFFVGHVVEKPPPEQAPALQHGLIHVDI